MRNERTYRRARLSAVACAAGFALLGTAVGAGGTAAADPTPAAHHASTPGWKVALSGGAGGPKALLAVTGVDDSHAWAAGRGADNSGVLMRWDGKVWSAIADPALPKVIEWSDISAASSDDVWAYGMTGRDQYLAHYDGKQWALVPAAGALDRSWPEVPIKAVPGRLFKGGDALSTYSDGTWQTFGLPDGVDIRDIDARSADDAYATGMQYPTEGGHPVAYHWDGTTWTPMPQPPAPAVVELTEVAVDAADSVYAAGWGNLPDAAGVRTHVEHWDGAAWHDVTGELSAFLVEAIEPDGRGGLWAVGRDDSAVDAGPAFWHYDGSHWTKQAGATVAEAAEPSYSFHDIAPVDGDGGTRFLTAGEYPVRDGDITSSGALIEQTQSSLDLTTADLAVSSKVTHSVRVHAEESGRLTVAFRPAAGQPAWDTSAVDLSVTSVSGAPQGACRQAAGPVNGTAEALSCDLPAGDHTIAYTLAAGAYVDAWQIEADARFQASGTAATALSATAGFAIDSPYPVPVGSRFLGRDAKGTLWRYDGTGKAAAPYRARTAVGDGWQGYTAMTALSGLTVHGSGDLVARDASGVLWYYRGGGNARPFAPRVKAGGGWNAYTVLTGAGDLTGDGRADLLARDASGVLWLFPGTADPASPFAARVKIGSGWNTHRILAGRGDLTGDGHADLLAIDTTGALWLYQGTGKAAAPYAPRTKVGTGWGGYDTLVVPGDLTGDGTADLLARDASGALWLYRGTGRAAAPYAPRTKVGTGWSTYVDLV
ncbi:FG-GAP-like repeat-containing protein [Streptomyces sp. NPDC050085]|uniref:FG-GAP-like repeat-containing protein n=1 Tax=Streptomyces sp. NPDC050085 TaxID=3365600 RepID=UPI00378CE768